MKSDRSVTESGATPDGAGGVRPGVSRRNVVAAAAWSVPVIAVAVATPLAAASVATPTLLFNSPAFSMAGCASLTGVTVTGTTDGTTPVPAGTPITVTLPAGFTFVGASTSPLTLLAGAGGAVTLPAIKAPISATSATIAAVSGAVTVSSVVTLTQALGSTLWGGPQPNSITAITTAGLPAGAQIVNVYGTSSGVVFVTLADGTVYKEWENPSSGHGTDPWTAVPQLSGDVRDKIITSDGSAVGIISFVLDGGQLYVLNSSTNTNVAIGNPPAGPAVRIGTSNGYLLSETADGRLWWRLPNEYGAPYTTWTEITGAPTPVVDWSITQAFGRLAVIGGDGKLYGVDSFSASATALTPKRTANATWTEPAVSLAKSHTTNSAAQGGTHYAEFIDANGNMYAWAPTLPAAQATNLGGVLAGTLQDATVITNPDGQGDNLGLYQYVLRDGRAYRAAAGSLGGFIDITPPVSVLGTATVVDVHSLGAGGGHGTNVIDSQGRIWASNNTTGNTAPTTWTLIGPAGSNATGIVQDGTLSYTLAPPASCPI